MAESEDGGSLLGSSRKSLADTSVTSTADLSIFSGGQRSQHTTYDEDGHTINNSIHSNILYYDQEQEPNATTMQTTAALDATLTNDSSIPIDEDEEETSSPGLVFGNSKTYK